MRIAMEAALAKIGVSPEAIASAKGGIATTATWYGPRNKQ